jgi:hypothetical protein
MNDDVLATIAAFGDIDTRRSMGYGSMTKPLKRNGEFDERLQTIHRGRTVEYTRARIFHGPTFPLIIVQLNSCVAIHISPRGYEGDVEYGIQSCTFHIAYEYLRNLEWYAEYAVTDCTTGVQQVTSIVELDAPFSDYKTTSVSAEHVNGQWVVTSVLAKDLTAVDRRTLRRLGYEKVLAKRCGDRRCVKI